MTHPLELLVRDSLVDFAAFVMRTRWRGRERETVSLYAFGFLVRRCRPDGPLREPTQIGLDVAVPQIPGPKRKTLVCKDLVIWPEPADTCWDESGRPTRRPLAILEWKAPANTTSQYDESWLRQYSEQEPNFLGYAVSLDPKGAGTTLLVSRVRAGIVTRDWLRFPG